MTLFLFLGGVLQYHTRCGLLAETAYKYMGTDVSMQARFALSLSPDRIQLLQAVATGHELVGSADPSSPTLERELADLKSTGEALTGASVTCALVLPNEHIRYLRIDDAPTDETARREIAARALEAETPYKADALAIDIQILDGVMWVAGIAKETLVEAETFAFAHGFRPSDFIAWPEPSQFPGIPEFGSAVSERQNLEPAVTNQSETTPNAEPKAPKAARQSVLPTGSEKRRPDLTSQRRVPTFQTVRGSKPAKSHNRETRKTASSAARTHEPGQRRITPQLGKAAMTATQPRRRGVLLATASVAVVGFVIFASAIAGPKIANFFALLSSPTPTAQFTAPQQPSVTTARTVEKQASPSHELVSLNGGMSDEDAAVLDALRAPLLTEPVPRADRTEDELRAAYAVTGIWPIAPDVPSPPSVIELNDLYQTSVDPIDTVLDAIALPSVESDREDLAFVAPAAPAPAGTDFVLDGKGLVVPTLEGTLNPDGVMVFAGTPPLSPPDKLERAPVPVEAALVRPELEGFRPKARPGDLIETTERAAFSGLTRSELGQLRPRMRPQSEQEIAEQETAAATAASASLVPLQEGDVAPIISAEPVDAASLVTGLAASLRPDARPNNFATLLASRENNDSRGSAPAPAPTQATVRVTPRNVAPSIPSSASVTREATIQNAINLRRVNLIGVYGKPSSRRALVRLGNGRYRKVEVGDRIDGGRVSAIGDAELRYQKSGRDVVLTMPRS